MKINGQEYFAGADVVRKLGITRQTLWRWRREGSVPPGQKYRDRLIVFTVDEVALIQQHADRMEKIEITSAR